MKTRLQNEDRLDPEKKQRILEALKRNQKKGNMDDRSTTSRDAKSMNDVNLSTMSTASDMLKMKLKDMQKIRNIDTTPRKDKIKEQKIKFKRKRDEMSDVYEEPSKE